MGGFVLPLIFGAFMLSENPERTKQITKVSVGFAAGAFVSIVFMMLIPETYQIVFTSGYTDEELHIAIVGIALVIICGIILFSMVEKILQNFFGFSHSHGGDEFEVEEE